MNILQYLLGQFGDQDLKRSAKNMLLTRTELGSKWELTADRSWRTGLIGKRSGPARRARSAGTFTALRRFSQQAPYFGLFLEAICYAPEDRAEHLLSNFDGLLLMKPMARSRKVSQQEVEIVDVDRAISCEIEVRTKEGMSSQKLIAGSVRNVMFVVSGTGYDGGWDWNAVMVIASFQGEKIRNEVNQG